MTEEVSSTTASKSIDEREESLLEKNETEESWTTTSVSPVQESEPALVQAIQVEKTELITSGTPETPSSANRTFAPLNIPLSRRRQTLTILVWFLLPWTCLYISFLLLRCNNWYVVGTFILYLTWMMFMQKYPREGGYKQQWLRRLAWWKWFAGK